MLQVIWQAFTELRLRNLRMQVPRLVISSPPPARTLLPLKVTRMVAWVHTTPRLLPISLAVYLTSKQVSSRQDSLRPKPTQVVPSMRVLCLLV